MDKHIIIIHPSAMIRMGLESMIRQEFDYPVSQSATAEAVDVRGSEEVGIIVLTNQPHTDFSGLQEKSKALCVIGIKDHPEQKKKGWIRKISTNTDSTELKAVINTCFDKQEEQQESSSELSQRETEILALVARGYANKEIADQLFISTHTVISHRKNITEKLGIKTISGLTVYAMINGIIDLSQISRDDLI
ncbi:MAG: LuxR C-terminal-related transcriptional regulator [Bacteroidales bacterium]